MDPVAAVIVGLWAICTLGVAVVQVRDGAGILETTVISFVLGGITACGLFIAFLLAFLLAAAIF